MDSLDILPGTIFLPVPECHAITLHIPSVLEQLFPDRPELKKEAEKKRQIFRKDDFSISILSDNELVRLNGFKILKKQTEWLCGRYAVKKLFHAAIDPDIPFQKIVLDHEDLGAPFILSHPHIPVSISHSCEYAAAILSPNVHISLGMDMEKIGKTPDEHFLKIAFTPREISAMDKTAQGIFCQWTLKEAYLKLIKKGFHEGLGKVEIVHEKIFHKGLLQNIHSCSRKIHKEYAISLVWKKQTTKNKKTVDGKGQ